MTNATTKLSPAAQARKDQLGATAGGDRYFGHRHYALIAGTIKAQRDEDARRGEDRPSVDYTFVEELVQMFTKDNPRFDRKRFLTACGYSF